MSPSNSSIRLALRTATRAGRLVTVAYFTLVRPDVLKPKAADDAAAVGWYAVDALPSLAFDHATIIALARRRLRRRLARLPRHSAIFPKRLRSPNCEAFMKSSKASRSIRGRSDGRVLALQLIEETGKMRTGRARPERVYRATTQQAR